LVVGLRLTILGSGTSHGIPMIACDCAVCTSPDPRDRRTRASALFSFDTPARASADADCGADRAAGCTGADRHLLVDTGPELRLQCLACGVRRVDAILYTHAHADHVVGLDDVRRFNWVQHSALNVYGAAATLKRIHSMFRYAFEDQPDYPSAKPALHAVPITGPFELFGRRVIPIPYQHGTQMVLGFRVGDIAYCPDCSFIPDESRALLAGLEVLVLDGLRRRPHPTHFNLEQAVEEAHRIGARRTYLTHIAHELLHAPTNAELPPGIELAYDGLVCESD
jgi:phosphoribosyl 1,2-cyclic phosphate phosphodiesterase